MKNISVPAGLLALCACALCALANEDDHWDVKFGASGADGFVTSMTTSGSDVYVTGNFTSAGEAGCIGIAKWDGTNWMGFGSGFSWGSLPVGFAVAVKGADVYVGGAFITNISGVPVRSLAKWNGSSWSDVGGGMDGVVFSMLFKGNDLYVAGVFSEAGGVMASNIVRWDGTNWFALGTGLSGATNGFIAPIVYSMALDSNGDLIVVGNFRFAGGVEVNNVARWDGSQWHALGGGIYNGGSGLSASSVAVLGTNVYVSGLFKTAGGVNATNIARWNGTQWSAMGGGPFGTNTCLAIVGTNIYTAGNFTNIQGVAARHVARWNGAAWVALAPGTAGEISTRVSCLASDGSRLYAGGDFIRAGNAGTLAIAQWNGIQWSALAGPKSQGAWLSPRVISAAGNSNVYLGGTGLLIAGGLKPNRVAHWNGSAWDDMGGGVTGGGLDVNVILKSGGNVYVGGDFTNAGGVAARSIGYWDGVNWHAMASGLNSNVNALCFHNGQLFAGGAFTKRGNGTGNLTGIARWDGSDWVDVPVISSWRINNVINALESDGANLYVGGNYFIGWFNPAPPFNGANVDNIGYWDGSNWWPLGTGLSNTVTSLAFMGGNLYAGGIFTNSGPTLVRRIARWTGSAWTEVGGGIANGTVSALAAAGSSLYVGGNFTNAGGLAGFSRIVRWDGGQWRTLGSGISRISPTSSSVSRISVTGEDVYLTGSFTHAGGRPSSYVAHWNETVYFVPPVIRLLNAGMNGSHQFHFDISGLSYGPFTVQATTNFSAWSDIHSGAVPNTNFTDVNSPGIPSRSYRVKAP